MTWNWGIGSVFFLSIVGRHMICSTIEVWSMSSTISETKLTPEDLLKLPDEMAFELVDGNLVERHMGSESSAIALRIAFLLALYLRDNPLGLTFGSDTGYQCYADDPKKIRRADLGFV